MEAEPGKKKILLIDDDVFFQNVITDILSGKYNVLTSKSGNEALLLLVKFKPDLILLDILMPEMNGWETYQKIRGISLLSEVPIAFLTSVNEAEWLEQAKKLGASEYFTKPVVSGDFLKRIEKILK